MKKTYIILALNTLFALLVLAPVLAAAYSTTFTVVETGGTAYTMLGTQVLVDNQYLADNNFMEADALDTRVETFENTAQPHMVVDDRTLAATVVAANSQTNLFFSTDNSDLADMPIVTGVGYAYIIDSAALEPGNNFQFDIDGYVETSAASDKNLLFKRGAFRSYISSANTITSSIMGGFTWTVPTSAVDTGSGWNNEANAWDNNTGTSADSDSFSGAGVWTEFLELNIASLWTDRFRYWVTIGDASVNVIDLDAFYSGGWNHVFQGAFATGAYETQTMTNWQQVTALRIRLQDSDGGVQVVNIFEAHFAEDAAQVTVTQAAVTSGEYVIRTLANATDLELYLDGVLQDTTALGGVSITNNNENWNIGEGRALPYYDSYQHTVGGTLIVHYQPITMIIGTTLPDREGAAQNGTFWWSTNPAGVAVTLGGMVSANQPGATDITEVTLDVLPAVETTDWFESPDVTGALLTNPLRPFVTMMSDETALTELQSWRFLGLVFVILVFASVAKSLRGHYLLTSIMTGLSIGTLVALTIWPMWTLIFIIGLILGGLVAERSPSL